jgi:alpha-tubulin suppressor-like RCC1 family protein
MRLRLFAALGAVLATSILTVALAASPVGAAPFSYTSVSTGYHRTCAVTTDGLGLCWGWNHSGSLGTTDRSSTVFTPSLITLPAGERFRDIAAGSYFTSCGLTESGNVYCWGESGAPGRLLLPAGVVVTQLSVGASQVCALTSEQHLYCHGDWNSGELGIGDAEYTHLPVRVQLPDAAVPAFVSAGIGFTCVVATSGTAYCSGVNAAGQLGNGGIGTTKVFTRVAMPAGVAFSAISAGLERACAVDTTGGGWCWGQNYNGALGDDTYAHSRTPRAVAVAPGTTLTDIQTGWYHTCAITATGTTLCWGSNDQGALGWGQTYGGKTIRIAALPDGVQARQLEVGLAGTCINSTDGRIFCWGSNLRGSVGNGTAAPVYTPAEVLRVGTPDVTRPTFETVATHSAVVSGAFVPNGATTSATVVVSTNPSFDDARTIIVPLRRQQQSTLAQLFAPVNFSVTVSALRPATEYHVKVRTNNTFGLSDSPTSSFVTPGSAPSVVTTWATDIGGDTATISTTVDPGLLDTSVHVTFATDAAFTHDVRTVALGTAGGSGESSLTTTLTALAARTLYFARIEASNEVGTTTGETITFATIGDAPVIGDLRAVGGRKVGTVTLALDAGLLRTNVIVAYRPSGSVGSWQSMQREVDASATEVSFTLTGLQAATTYDVKATATNAVGGDSTEGVSFTTTGGAPTIVTPEAHDVADSSVTLRTSVDSNEFATRVTLQIDTSDSFSNYDEWFAGSAVADSVSRISLDVSELVDSSVYYARFVAVNAKGSTVSEVVSFTTSTPVGKLLKRRTDPVDPEPIVEPTPPGASAPPITDEPVLVLTSPTNPRRPSARMAVKASVAKATPARKPVKKSPKSPVKKRSIAR